MTHEQEKKMVFDFLDELEKYPHNEQPSWLLRSNFGISHGMSVEYVAAWKFEKRLDAALDNLLDKEKRLLEGV